MSPRRKPWTLTMGTPMTAPDNFVGSMSCMTRRTISMPLSSSPCTAAIRQSVGPGNAPLTTSTGVETGTPSKSSVADQENRCAVPGSTSRRQEVVTVDAAPLPQLRHLPVESGQIGQCWGGIDQVFHGHGDFAGTRIGIFGRIFNNIGAVIAGARRRLAGESRGNRNSSSRHARYGKPGYGQIVRERAYAFCKIAY